MIDIPKPGIFYELGSASGTPFGLRHTLINAADVPAAVDQFWDDLEAITPTISAVCLHLMNGKASAGVGSMTFDSVHQILKSTNPKVLAYYKKMRRRLELYLLAHPEIEVYYYLGSLYCYSMYSLLSDPSGTPEWISRWKKETLWLTDLMDKGANLRIVLDESSKYEQDSLEWRFVQRLVRDRPGRVVMEAMPLRNPDQASLPCFAEERVYQAVKDRVLPGVADITRFIYTPQSGEMDDFLIDCARHGHRAFITDTMLRGTSISQVHAAAQQRAHAMEIES